MDFSLFEYVPDGIVIVDRDAGVIVHVNGMAEDLFGYSRRDLVGQPLECLIPAGFRVQHRQHVAAYDAAPRRRPMRQGLELFGLRKDGREFPAEITLSPFSDGDRRFAVAAIRDVSDRKALERAAHLLLRQQEMLKERNAFLSTAAHELRTPVAALQLRLDILHRAAEKEQAPLPRLHVENMGDLERLTRRITLVVNSIVDVAQMRPGGTLELQVEDVDLVASTRRVITKLQADIAKSGSDVSLAADGAVVGRWDGARLEQVLTNLLVNAIRFGDGKRIQVAVESDEQRARVVVTDHGIGIPPEDQKRIFDRFETVSSPDAVPGLGLGLYVCGEIVGAHGGTIEVESTPGAGSKFTVEFPRAPADPAE